MVRGANYLLETEPNLETVNIQGKTTKRKVKQQNFNNGDI